MASDIQLTGGSIPLTISGKEFKASTLRDRDYAELNAWIQEKVIQQAVAAAASLTEEQRADVLKAALSVSIGITWTSPEGLKILSTAEGTARLGWQMCQKRHNVSYEEFYNLFYDEENDAKTIQNANNIDRAYGQLNTSLTESSDEGGEEDDGKKSQKSKSTKK